MLSTSRNLAEPELADSEVQALAHVKQTDPDLVLVDISLKSGHGIELIKRIRSLDPAVKMLVITGFQESLYAERAFRAGALGYLNKQESNEKMIEAMAGKSEQQPIGIVRSCDTLRTIE